MLETSKPQNVYYSPPESGYDSAAHSAESSRRNSNGFREMVKKRRFSIVGRFTSRNSSGNGDRKPSGDSATAGDSADEQEDDLSPRPLFQRRMSVPEKVFLSADYAILRPTQESDVRFEIVAAFDRHTDPYRHYMQSLTCYDLAPIHGAVAMIDGRLMIHKALTVLIQYGHQAAVVCNLEIKGGLSMLTFTDCLRAIVMASKGITVANKTVEEFIGENNGKQLITATTVTSVWDAAKMICLNSVHRVPILQEEECISDRHPGDVLYMLTLKNVLNDTVLKLSDPKFSLGPHIKLRTLSEAKIGTWNDLHTVSHDAKCIEAIEVFLERRISCVPIVNEHKKIVGVLSKNDLMVELQLHPNNYLEILNMGVMEVLGERKPVYASPTMTILEIIGLLLTTDKQAVFVVNVDGHVTGVVSYADLMDYIQNSSDIHHKMSCV